MVQNQRPWDNQPGETLEQEAAQFRNRVAELYGKKYPLLKYVNGNSIENIQELVNISLKDPFIQQFEKAETRERLAYDDVLRKLEQK